MFQSNHATGLNQFCSIYLSFDSSLCMKRIQQLFNFLKVCGSNYLLFRVFIRTLHEKYPNKEIFLVRIQENTDHKKTPYLDTTHAVYTYK